MCENDNYEKDTKILKMLVIITNKLKYIMNFETFSLLKSASLPNIYCKI